MGDLQHAVVIFSGIDFDVIMVITVEILIAKR